MIVVVHSFFGFTSGISQHAENFSKALERVGVSVIKNHIPNNQEIKVRGDVTHITLCGVQEFAHFYKKRPGKNIAYIAWESTEYPQHFVEAMNNVDELWVTSTWQKEHSDKQLGKENFVKVVPEGVDIDVFKPGSVFPQEIVTKDVKQKKIRFLIFGRWEDRKSTKEMIQYWLEEFKDEPNVELILSVDNQFPVDQYSSTEERLAGYGLSDNRIKIIHFPDNKQYINYLQNGHVLLHASRAEGWGLVNIEAMACGIPVICTDWSGNTEYCREAITVPVKEFVKPFNVYGVPDCPGLWAEPDWGVYKQSLRAVYEDYDYFLELARNAAINISNNFSWKQSALKAAENLGIKTIERKPKQNKEIFVVGCYPDTGEKMSLVEETIGQIHDAGYEVVITTHYQLPKQILEKADYVVYEKNNVLSGDWKAIYWRSNREFVEYTNAKKQYHAVSVLNNIRNAIDFCLPRWKTMYYMEYDIGVDLNEFIKKCTKNKLKASFIGYENRGLRTDIWSGNIKFLDKIFPRINSWAEYIDSDNMGLANSGGYVLEFWLKKHFEPYEGDYGFIQIETDNLFNQKDTTAWEDDLLEAHFNGGAFFNIVGIADREYDVVFSSPKLGDYYRTMQKTGTWTRPNILYYQDWNIRASLNGKEVYNKSIDLKDKRVFLAMGSRALGDTIAWVPYFEEFRKKHQCHVIAVSWWNRIFDYPEIEWIEPGGYANNIYAKYEVGCYDNDLNRNVVDWRTVTLQKVATDILGLEYTPLKPKLKYTPATKNIDKKYFCFSEFSTMRTKLWQYPGGWQRIIDYLADLGYVGVSISVEPTKLNNVIKANGMSIEHTMSVLASADFYIGLGHGPSWVAWALGIPTVLISGFSEPFHEFDTKYRILPPDGFCRGCFGNTKYTFNREWEWCPEGRHYECSKSILPEMVIENVNKLIEEQRERA